MNREERHAFCRRVRSRSLNSDGRDIRTIDICIYGPGAGQVWSWWSRSQNRRLSAQRRKAMP